VDIRSERGLFADWSQNQIAGYITGAAYMAQWPCPDLFADLNPSGIHQEYLERFQAMAMPDTIFVHPASEP